MKTCVVFLLLAALVLVVLVTPFPASVTKASGPLPAYALAAAAPPGKALLQCPADDYEPNGSFDEAAGIAVGVEHTAYICPSGDEDWFRFAVIAGQVLTVDLYGLYGGDLPADYDLDVYDPGGTLVAQSRHSFTYPEHTDYTAQQDGEYRARITGYGGAYSGMDPYRLQATLSAAPTATPTLTPVCPVDDYEPNDGYYEARPIPVVEEHTAYLCPSGEEDWFLFEVYPGQEIVVDLYGLYGELPADYDLYLFNPLEAQVGESAAGGAAPEQIVHIAQEEGLYRVRVIGYQGAYNAQEPYRLRVTLTSPATETPTAAPTLTRTATPTHTPVAPPTATWTVPPTHTPTALPTASHTPTPTAVPPATATPTHTQASTGTPTATQVPCPTEYEPNDTFEQASPIQVDQPVPSHICPADDVDIFRFFLELGQLVSVHLYGMDYNADLEVYDPSKAPIGQSSQAGTTPEELAITAEQDGWFYARVFGTAEDLVNPYVLLVATTGLPPTGTPTATPTMLPTATTAYPGCPGDVHEPNDLCGADQPSWNVTTSTTRSYICATTDVDYWRIPSVGISETIDIALNPGDQDYRLWLYDPQCNPVKPSMDAYKGTVRMRHTAAVAGMWFVKVHTALGFSTTEPYTITGRVESCRRDRLEDNDDVRLRTPLDRPLTEHVEQGLSICPADEQDWFAVRLETGDNLYATLTHNSSTGPLKMCLYDPVLADLQCTDPFLGLNRIDYVSPAYGFHYLVVDGAAPGVVNHDYGISVHVRVPTPTPTPTATLTPTPTRTPVFDLSVEEVEVTQAIQDLHNSIPLVKGKLTRARVYVGAPANVTRLSGLEVWLYGYANNPYGSALPGSPLKIGPGTYTLAGGTVAQKRLSLASSFNFEIPASWQTYGSIALRAVVNPNRTFSEPDFGNNELIDSVFWRTCSTVNLRLVSVTSDGITVSLTSDLVTSGLSWMKDVYPISQLSVSTLASGAITATRNYAAPSIGGSCSAQWSALVSDMADIYDNWTNRPANAFVYGFLSPSVPHGNTLGCGRVNGHAAAGILAADAGETLAHEVGHNLGRLHAPCSVPDPDPGWPTGTNPNGSIGEVGVRWSTSAVFGTGTPDFMSYCSPPWVSTVTYRALETKLCTASASSAESVGSASPHLVASGSVGGGALELRPLWVLDQPTGDYDHGGVGPYSLELQDASGLVLFVRHFDPAGESQGRGHTSDYFHEIVPYAPETQRVVFRHGEALLGTVQVSAHSPQVTVLSPNGGEVWGATGAHTISWQADDMDGDSLVAHVLYSFDGGESWEPLAVNVHGNQYRVQGDRLPGSDQVLVQVRVSDGLNTTSDQSDAPFRVSRKAPLAFVLQLQDGAVVPPGTPVVFSGLASDPEDGPVPVESLVWTSDVDGVLGTGADIAVGALSAGTHHITLSATDSDSNVAQDTIRLWVGSQVYLPVVLK